MRALKVMAVFVALAALVLAWRTAAELPGVEAATAGQKLRLRGRGPAESRVTVVFEIGLGGVLEEWAAVQDPLSATVRTVAYDRLPSRHTGKLTGAEVVAELHAALRG